VQLLSVPVVTVLKNFGIILVALGDHLLFGAQCRASAVPGRASAVPVYRVTHCCASDRTCGPVVCLALLTAGRSAAADTSPVSTSVATHCAAHSMATEPIASNPIGSTGRLVALAVHACQWFRSIGRHPDDVCALPDSPLVGAVGPDGSLVHAQRVRQLYCLCTCSLLYLAALTIAVD
jgi:hypothetical protein